MVIYIRVSTKNQGQTGLGLEAQKATCMSYIESKNAVCRGIFQDIESGTSRTRKGLKTALDYCKRYNYTLVIAKLDRLARDVEFTFQVLNTGVQIYFCDMPQVNTMILGVFASVAQYERELISKRTREGLQVRKRQIDRGESFVSKSGNICTRLGSKSSVSDKAIECAARIRVEKAKDNQSNIFLGNFIREYESRSGRKITRPLSRTLLLQLSDSLNMLGARTPTGMCYTPERLKSQLTRWMIYSS